jgi:hypothetical protein
MILHPQRSRAPARAPARRPAPPSAAPPSRPVSTTASTTPAPMQQPSSGGGGMLSGIGSTIVQGMAFGTGSAIAHRAVGAVADSFSGGSSGEQQQQVAAQPVQQQVPSHAAQDQGVCGNDKQMFYECLQVNKGDQQACSFLYEQLKQCQSTSTSMSFN